MNRYAPIVALLNFMVNFFLLLGTNRIAGHSTKYLRAVLASGFGGVYGGLCMFRGLHFLGNTLWRLVSIALICWIAFGSSKSTLRKGALFALLHLALTGIAAGMDGGGFWSVLVTAGAISLVWVTGLWSRPGLGGLVPVELLHNGQRLSITALQDTGNTLRDPVTGQPVLVVGADVAQRLTGLTREQLHSPVEVMRISPIPGLRLIPYHTIDKAGGLLLAMRIAQVKIGSQKGSALVAFAPEVFGEGKNYQALTGGAA